MQFTVGEGAVIQTQGLDQFQARVQVGEEAGLEQAFPVLGGGLGVGDDAAAHPHDAAPVGAQFQAADGHVEAEIPVRRQQPQAAGVQAPGPDFQFLDDFHGPQLGCAGDGTAGKEGRQGLRRADARGPGADRGGHLEDAGVGLDGEQLLHPHRTGLGQAPQVVAQQINDHQVFRPVLGRGRQGGPVGRIAGLVRPPRRGALHGPGTQGVAAARDEQFGGQGEYPPLRCQHQTAQGRRLALPQTGVEGQGMAVGMEMQGKGEIDLVAVASGDVVPDALHRRGMGGLVQPRHQLGDTAGGLLCRQGRHLVRQPVPGGIGVKSLRRGEKPQVAPGRWAVGQEMRASRLARLQQAPQFVIQGQHGPPAPGGAILGGGQPTLQVL